MIDLRSDLLFPIFRRVGSLVAGSAVAIGATTDEVSTLEAGIAVLLGLALDLYTSHRDAKKKRSISPSQ